MPVILLYASVALNRYYWPAKRQLKLEVDDPLSLYAPNICPTIDYLAFTWPMLTEIGLLVLGAVIGKTADYLLRKWISRRKTTKEWYQEAISLASHAMGLCDSAKKRSDLNYGDISEQAEEISIRLREQTDPYPKTVDQESVFHIKQLSEIFSKIHATTEATEEKSSMDALEEILAMATRESIAEPDADMGKAFDQSTEHSAIMKSLFRKSDLNPQIFGANFRENLEEADSMEDLFKSMGSGVGIDSKRVERTLENFAGNDWDNSLSLAVRAHLQLAESLSQDAINHLSQVSKMEAASSTNPG